MKGTLYVQRDSKGRKIEKPTPMECEIDLGKDGQAVAGVVGKAQMVTDPLVRARVEFIAANGLFIRGLVKGLYRSTPTVQYQEWWFVPIVTGREEALNV